MSGKLDIEIKKKTSRLYELCARLFKREFDQMFHAPQKEFRDWLNLKTGCNVDHIGNLNNAMDEWISVLEKLKRVKE